MYSNIIPFRNIVDAVKDETGILNLRNQYPQIRRLVYRAERDIGYGYGLLLKKITYKKSDGTIFEGKVRLPSDLLIIEAIGTCQYGLCPGDYNHQGNYLFFCNKEIEEFDLVYYTMLCDGEGNPAITENHFEAVLAGVKYFMYQAKMWAKEGSMAYYKELKLIYFDACGEARGNDVMPSTDAEWEQIASHLKMSYRDILIYDNNKKCWGCAPTTTNTEILTEDSGDMIYYWQYEDLASDISLAPAIDLAFLQQQNKATVDELLNGIVVSYASIGRIAFAITGVSEDYYQLVDVFKTDITNIVFDTYYNTDLKTQIYISKEYYSHGNIYFEIIKN